MSEQWLPVRGLAGRYEVSNTGLVRSVRSNRTRGKVLKPAISVQGYYRIGYWLQGTHKNFPVHRAVAQSFIPNPFDLPQVNHINGNKLDNHVANLEWCTGQENIRHGFRTGLYKRKVGSENSFAILDESKVRDIRERYANGTTQTRLALDYGVNRSAIYKVITRRSWAHV